MDREAEAGSGFAGSDDRFLKLSHGAAHLTVRGHVRAMVCPLAKSSLQRNLASLSSISWPPSSPAKAHRHVETQKHKGIDILVARHTGQFVGIHLKTAYGSGKEWLISKAVEVAI